MKYLFPSTFTILGLLVFLTAFFSAGGWGIQAQIPDVSNITLTATGIITVKGAAGSANCINNYLGEGAQDYKVCKGEWSMRFGAVDLQACKDIDPQLVQNMQRHSEAFVADMHRVINVPQDFVLMCVDGWTP